MLLRLFAKEIELEDMQIAVKLSDERTLGLDPRQRIIHLIEGDVNTGEGRDLLKLINRDAVQNRYPPGAYSQRCFSYIPGVDAYPEVTCTINNKYCLKILLDAKLDSEWWIERKSHLFYGGFR